jgi:hypothetical protein
MTGICAFRPAGVDVNRSLLVATVNVAAGEKFALADDAGGPKRSLGWTLNLLGLGVHLGLGRQAASATLLSLGGAG